MYVKKWFNNAYFSLFRIEDKTRLFDIKMIEMGF